MQDISAFFNSYLWSVLLSRRAIAIIAVAVLKAYQSQLGISDEFMQQIETSVWVWVGAESLRSSKDGSGIVAALANQKKGDSDATPV